MAAAATGYIANEKRPHGVVVRGRLITWAVMLEKDTTGGGL